MIIQLNRNGRRKNVNSRVGRVLIAKGIARAADVVPQAVSSLPVAQSESTNIGVSIETPKDPAPEPPQEDVVEPEQPISADEDHPQSNPEEIAGDDAGRVPDNEPTDENAPDKKHSLPPGLDKMDKEGLLKVAAEVGLKIHPRSGEEKIRAELREHLK